MRIKTLLCFLMLGVAADAEAQNIHSISSDNTDQRQQLQALQKAVEELTSTVKAQQQEIQALKGANSSPVEVAASPPRPSGTYTPDIGVVADVVGTSTESREDDEGNDRVSLRELELIFGHDIDPFARMDAVVTFSDQEDPDVEEANITYWGLPLDVKARVGRMRQRIGKASAMHRDSLDTVDEPFVIQKYFGSEGYFRTGLELSAFTPLSLEDYTQELVLGVTEGGTNEGELFGETRRHPTVYAHLPNFWQISDLSSFELGATYLLGSKDEDSKLNLSVFGIDGTYLHAFGPIQKMKLQTELYFQKRDEEELPVVTADNNDEAQFSSSNPFGFYTLADFRMSERFGLGARYDYVEPTFDIANAEDSEQAYTGYLTFFQSEFARWRFQYQHVRLLEGDDDNRLLLQGTFAIGAHKHSLN